MEGEITQEQFLAAAQSNPAFVTSLMPTIMPTIQESDAFKLAVEGGYKSSIGEEVKNIHGRYDQDAFTILGDKPKSLDSGGLEKSYDFNKRLLTELKDFRSKKEELNADSLVQKLKSENERLKTEGGGSHVQAIFDASKKTWEEKEQAYLTQIEDQNKSFSDSKKKGIISVAASKLKIKEGTPESVSKMILSNAEAQLLANSTYKDDKLVFLDANGQPLINKTTLEAMTAEEAILSIEAIKDIMFVDDKSKGGGADPKLKGSIGDDGKGTKKLNLDGHVFKTQSEFIKTADEVLLKSGITRENPEFFKLKDEAFKSLKISNLPF